MITNKQIEEALKFIRKKTKIIPKYAMILGSGLGNLANDLKDQVVIDYKDIPNFVFSNAVGHANQLVIGYLNKTPVVIMKGRIHYYEGYPLEQITFPIRVLKALGAQRLIITNACGAINKTFKAGQLMLIRDHINLVGTNPLIGENNNSLGTRFPDLTDVYSKELRAKVKVIASSIGIKLVEGVYAWWSGPAYETPAEINMIRIMGGDAVGMSTVPEAIVAAHSNMPVVGISLLSNMAAGMTQDKLSHKEVLDMAKQVESKFKKLVTTIVDKL
jgi:purine-nucleoside phosphorylase